MKVVVTFEYDDTELRDQLDSINDERRQSGMRKVGISEIKAALKDPVRLELAAQWHLESVLESLGAGL